MSPVTVANDLPVDTVVTVTPHDGKPYRGVVRGHTSTSYLIESLDDPDDWGTVAARYVKAAS
jgi:hypothetical protein